jgi:hypothetical protein
MLRQCDVSYNRSTLLQNMEKLLSLWVDHLNKKNIPLTPAVTIPRLMKISTGALQWRLQNICCSGLQICESKCTKFYYFMKYNFILYSI